MCANQLRDSSSKIFQRSSADAISHLIGQNWVTCPFLNTGKGNGISVIGLGKSEYSGTGIKPTFFFR